MYFDRKILNLNKSSIRHFLYNNSKAIENEANDIFYIKSLLEKSFKML